MATCSFHAPRTSDARLWLYCVLSANFVVERMICSYSLQDPDLDPSDASVDPSAATLGVGEGDMMTSEALYIRIWLARKVSVLVCVCVSGYFAFTFIDYNKANHRLLEDIRQQNVDLKQKMELMQLANKPTVKHHRDIADSGGFPEKALVDPFTGGADDDGELADESSDDDTLSFDSTATDRTWHTSAAPPVDSVSVMSSDDEEDGDVNEDDFLTALNSNNNSPDIPEELAKLSDVARDDGLGPLPTIKKSARKSSSRTPSRRTSRSSRASTPSSVASPNHSYNLRNRRGSLQVNPVYENETEKDFVNQVRKMLKRSDRNKVKIEAAEKRSHIGAFSSDEASDFV